MQLITEERPVRVVVDEEFHLPAQELLDVLYELEGADGRESVHYITVPVVAEYLLKKRVVVKRPSGGYRLESESLRTGLINKIEELS